MVGTVVATLRKADGAATDPSAPAESPLAAAGDSRYAPANRRIRESAMWMAAALAAVATVLVGTSPLSGIGRLSAEQDPTRLAVAVGSIVLGLVAALLAIFLLTRIQMPRTILAADVVAMAAQATSPISREAQHELYLTAGRADVATLLEEFQEVQRAYYRAEDDLTAAERAVLEARTRRQHAVARSQVARARAKVAFEDRRDARLAPAVGYLTDLAVHQSLRSTAARTLPWVLALAVLAGACFVVFAWAANPPESPGPGSPATQTTPAGHAGGP